MTKVLIVEDDVAFALMLRTWLSKNGYEAESVVSAEQAVKRMGECVFDVVLSDLRLPDRDGITLLEWIRHKSPHSEVIIMTGYANVSTAVAAIKLGAFDYLEKPVNPEILREKMTAAVTRHEQRRSRPETQSASEPGTAIVWGHSEASAKLRDHLLLVAPTNMSVLITGESGTGKEVMAGSIHNASRRGSKPFLSINSAAIPATLMESELFGYEPGAFTGGKKNGSPGMFEFAHGGTLFLDEIGEMPLELQSKLLRVIQEKEVRRIGASRVIPVDVRIIAATNKDLNGEVAANRFRADLYYRLNILHLHLPPLRAYTESAGEIAEKILRKLAPGSEPDRAAPLRALLAKTGQYRWPGNLRELENIVRRYLALSPYLSRSIKLSDIFEPSELAEGPRESGGWENSGELQKILSTYYRMGCSKTLTAQELGISRSTLWRKLRQIRNPDS